MKPYSSETDFLSRIASLSSPRQVQAWQRNVRKDLPRLIGDFPERTPAVPPARITGRIEREDCVIEKVVFESRARFHVTANLYLPRTGTGKPHPAVLFTCGHSENGKAYVHYHACSLGLAQKGYVVLNYDPVGQGERSQYIEGRNLWRVGATVDQHNAIARPAFLLGQTLLNFRIWDGIRALDYLLSRPEVDAARVGIVGNSGGGEMALVIAAVDERISVCAACSPGGSCESIYLGGLHWPRACLLSLIPPRPLLVQCGAQERKGIETVDFVPPWLRGLYAKLGADPAQRTHAVRTAGIEDASTHSLERLHREQVYAWCNRWLDNEAAGTAEGPIRHEPEARLQCTLKGQVLLEFPREESTFTLLRALGRAVRPPVWRPRDHAAAQREAKRLRSLVRGRFALDASALSRSAPTGGVLEEAVFDGYRLEKAVLDTGDGFTLRALLHLPLGEGEAAPRAVIIASEWGKQYGSELAVQLARHAIPALSLDVRLPCPAFFEEWRGRRPHRRELGHHPGLYAYDRTSIDAVAAGRPLPGQQAGDVLRALDWLSGRPQFARTPVTVIGHGIGGLWAVLAAAFDRRVAGVVAWRTLPSLWPLVEEQYYGYPFLNSYFWLPGMLRELDIPDLFAIAAPTACLVMDPVDAGGDESADPRREDKVWAKVRDFYRLAGAPDAFTVAASGDNPARRLRLIRELLDRVDVR